MLYNYILDVNYYDKNNILRNRQFECKENLNLNALLKYLNRNYNIATINVTNKESSINEYFKRKVKMGNNSIIYAILTIIALIISYLIIYI